VADVALIYRTHIEAPEIESLKLGECCIRKCADALGNRWWNLWFFVRRDDDPNETIEVAVPINPGFGFPREGPGGKTWGFTKTEDGIWIVSPSIDVVRDVLIRPHPNRHGNLQSLWHHTPSVTGVPDGERWQQQGV
jgi:hypothetical protein